MSLDETRPYYYSKYGRKEEDEQLLKPFNYILQIPGKKIRIKLINALNYWLNVPDEKLQLIIDIIDMLHNASLLIDDIEDNSTLRRGIPTAHSIYGIPITVHSANYISSIVIEKINSLSHPDALKVFLKQFLELHRGQGMEIYWRDNFICPSEAEYKTMIMRKTGSLFLIAVNLMQLFSPYKEDFSPLITTLGLYFQIRDDYCNLSLSEYADNKTYCEDLTEGKFSFPIIHALTTNPDDTRIMNILKKRTNNFELKRYCVQLLEQFGSLKYTRAVLEELETKVKTQIENIGGNPIFETILNTLKNWD